MPLSTTTIAGPFTLPDSNGVPLRGKFTLKYNSSDGTLRYPAEDKTMAGTVEYDVPASGVLNWTNLIAFPQAGLEPAEDLTATITFESRDKRHPVTQSWTIDELPAGTVSLDDLSDVLGMPVSLGLATELLAARDEAVAAAASATAIAGLTNTDSAIAMYIAQQNSLTQQELDKRGAVSAKAAGVVGDGSPTDTAKMQTLINSAITLGARVTLTQGTWLFGNLNCPAKTVIDGSGWGTILKVKNGLDADFITNTSGAGDIHIRNLSIDGNKANQTDGGTARGVYMVNAAHSGLFNVHIYDVEAHGAHFSNTGTVEGQYLSHSLIERSGVLPGTTYGSGLAVTNGTNFLIIASWALDNAKAGYRMSGSFASIGSVARRNGNGGLVPVSTSGARFTVLGGDYSDNGPGGDCDGIRLVGVVQAIIDGPICSGNSGAGIGVYNSCQRISIPAAFCFNNGQAGATPGTNEGRDGITVWGNTSAITDVTIGRGVQCWDDQGVKTQQYGIRLRGDVEYVTVSAGNLRGNAVAGFRNDSTTGTSVVVDKTPGIPLPTVDNTASTSPTGTTETDMKVVSFTAGTIGRKSGVRLRAAGTVTGTAGTKVVRLKVGGTGGTSIIAVSMAAGSTANWSVEADIFNTATNAQNVVLKGWEGTTLDVMSYSTLAVDTAQDFSIGVTGTLSNTADTIVCRQFTLEPI